MSSTRINRLLRLIRVTEALHAQSSRLVVDLAIRRDQFAADLNVANALLDDDGCVGGGLPSIIGRSAASIDGELGTAEADLERGLEAAALAKSKVNGVRGQLIQERASAASAEGAAALEEAIDGVVRNHANRLT